MAGLPTAYKHHVLAEASELPEEDIEIVEEIVVKYCSSLISTDYAETPVTLGPPVTSCYSCGRNLIRNHVTKIKCYSTIGVKGGQKVTLRCKECQVSYNYSKFGNKHENGFRHYSSAQPYSEASDTIYFDRTLHELQCCFA